jgi:hypothetical protein
MMSVVMVLTGCASSRRVTDTSHQEVKDSMRTEQTDSVRKTVVTSDSVQKSTQSMVQVSSSATEGDSLSETIHELITETTDAHGNKTTTTDRTIRRNYGSQKQSSSQSSANHQRHEIKQMQQSVDSIALSNKSDVGTHWAINDSLSDRQEKNTEDVKRQSFIEKASKNAFALFVILVIVLILTSFKKHTDNGKG